MPTYSLIVPTERNSRGDFEMGSVCGGFRCVCVVNIIVNPAVDWPPLLHTWPIMTYLGQDDHWVCPHMSCDFELRLTFDLDMGVNAKLGGYIFYASRKSWVLLVSSWQYIFQYWRWLWDISIRTPHHMSQYHFEVWMLAGINEEINGAVSRRT